jgi:hypothetical protein
MVQKQGHKVSFKISEYWAGKDEQGEKYDDEGFKALVYRDGLKIAEFKMDDPATK